MSYTEDFPDHSLRTSEHRPTNLRQRLMWGKTELDAVCDLQQLSPRNVDAT